jgi:hypothetical protein
MAASIGGSVGREGENREPDVELVQKLLAVRGASTPASPTGSAGR